MNKVKPLILIFVLLLTANCATVKKSEYYPADNKYDKKICILYHYTKMRNNVAVLLTEKLKADNIMVITDNAFNINKYNPKEYDLVVVFSGIHAFIPDAYPANYLYKYKNEKNIIHVFFTFLKGKGITEGKDYNSEIDSIAAASLKENTTALVDKIYELIIKKNSKRPVRPSGW